MKFIKIETEHTMAQLDSISDSILGADSNILTDIYNKHDYINLKNDIGNTYTYIIIDSKLDELIEIYNKYNVKFITHDITKEVLFNLVKSDGFVYDSFINKIEAENPFHVDPIEVKIEESLNEELKKYGREDIMVIVGGVIPAQDYQFLFDAGAVAVFGPGTKSSEAAISILEVLIED